MAAEGIPVDKLPDVVLGRDRGYARAEAMALLAASTHPRREALLTEVLENPREERRYRVVAAITLGRIDTAEAEHALMRNLTPSQPALGEVLKSLGRTGDRPALAAIESMKLSGDHPARGAWVFATALISYRLGLEGHDLQMPAEKDLLQPDTKDARPIDVRKLDEEQARIVIDALKRYPYGGIEFDTRAVTATYCAGEVNVICINREFIGAGLAKAGERKALVAVAALRSPETGDYSPSYLALTRPVASGGRIEVLVTRCSGKPALAGTARIEGATAEFQLRSVRRPGARAIVIRGTLRDGVVQAAEAASSITQEPRRIPRHIIVNR
jgi:hypothetical protein